MTSLQWTSPIKIKGKPISLEHYRGPLRYSNDSTGAKMSDPMDFEVWAAWTLTQWNHVGTVSLPDDRNTWGEWISNDHSRASHPKVHDASFDDIVRVQCRGRAEYAYGIARFFMWNETPHFPIDSFCLLRGHLHYSLPELPSRPAFIAGCEDNPLFGTF